ncbi:TetR/AcrR family transcriptional regulator [Yinghuangia sp. YIM S10712]|uniref:TetR/AcrR family transcriptional regulator n=1 Tax=Yinghuangia sp. YIM S10712 TaxID=3436930 RepID=UPI003F52E498
MLNARGTKMNRRGLATRERFLQQAIALLAQGGPDAAVANVIARETGVTWGVVQHQFGDADGVWAAVLDYALTQSFGAIRKLQVAGETLDERVCSVVDVLWDLFGHPRSRAVFHLRLALPHDPEVLRAEFPKTYEAYQRSNSAWHEVWYDLFQDLDVSPEKTQKIRFLLPAALRGMRVTATAPSADLTAAKDTFAEILISYLRA